VRGRNSDNVLILEKLGWEPSVTLKDGLKVGGVGPGAPGSRAGEARAGPSLPPAAPARLTSPPGQTPPQTTYFWIKSQIGKEISERGVDPTKYSSSTIVKCSAPTELGSLRQADGEEGFDKQ
jgi:GDP-D-mannose 3',5'-epimerase